MNQKNGIFRQAVAWKGAIVCLCQTLRSVQNLQEDVLSI